MKIYLPSIANAISGKITLINGFIPKISPILGKIDEIMKNIIPINRPITILLLVLILLILPKINGMAKNSIITVAKGFVTLSQSIFSWILASRLLLSRYFILRRTSLSLKL